MSSAAIAVDIMSGFCAGIAVTVVGHPFETLKVRLQTQPSPPNHVYDGFVDCVKKTLKWEGPGGFYKGVGAPLVGQLFFRSAMLWINGTWNRWRTHGGTRQMTYLDYGLGGAVTWALATTIENPLQTVSSQLQVAVIKAKTSGEAPEFKGVADYASHAPRKYGARALFAGIPAHLTRNCVGGFFHFGAFEALRREVAKSRGVPVEQVGLWTNMGAGAVGGVLFWTLTYPADVVKSAMQGDNLEPSKRKYNGTVDCVRKLWAEGGAGRFTRGFSACLARSVPANAVLLASAFRVKELGYAYLDGKKAAAAAPATNLK